MTKFQKVMFVIILVSTIAFFAIATPKIYSLYENYKFSNIEYEELGKESLSGGDVKLLDKNKDGSVIILYPEELDDSKDYEVEVIYDENDEVKAISVDGTGVVE